VTEAENNRDFAVFEELISPTYVNQSNQIKGFEGCPLSPGALATAARESEMEEAAKYSSRRKKRR